MLTSDLAQQPPHSPTVESKRPGWIEILVGLLAFAVTTVAVAIAASKMDLGPVAFGLTLAALSGVSGLAGFGAAAAVRVRSPHVFYVRGTSPRWLLVAVAVGVLALVLKGALNWAVIALTGFDTDPQGAYYDAAGGGTLSLILTFLFLSVLTPIGEEFLFRGVITNALLRYGPVIGVGLGTVIFGIAHGINIALPSALVVGFFAAEMMRRSGSIWPAVIVHSVNNAALPLLVLFTGFGGPS